MLDWLIASYLFGVITGFFVTAIFWVKAIERIKDEKADKQTA